jgi:hypothetical protein
VGMNPGTAISLAVAAALLTTEFAEAAAAPDAGISMHAAKMPAIPAHLHGWDDEFVFIAPITPPPPLQQPALTYAMQEPNADNWASHVALQSTLPASRGSAAVIDAAMRQQSG